MHIGDIKQGFLGKNRLVLSPVPLSSELLGSKFVTFVTFSVGMVHFHIDLHQMNLTL